MEGPRDRPRRLPSLVQGGQDFRRNETCAFPTPGRLPILRSSASTARVPTRARVGKGDGCSWPAAKCAADRRTGEGSRLGGDVARLATGAAAARAYGLGESAASTVRSL